MSYGGGWTDQKKRLRDMKNEKRVGIKYEVKNTKEGECRAEGKMLREKQTPLQNQWSLL